MFRRLVVPAVLLLAASFAHAGEIDAEYHESFDISPGARLELTHGDGDVTIMPWDKDQIQIDVSFHMSFSRYGFGKDPKFAVEFTHAGDTIRVREQWTGAVTIGGYSTKRREYTYTIQAPAWMMLDLRGEDGDVEVSDWAADLRVRGEDGDVRLSGIEGDVRAELEDGDLTIRGISGHLEVNSDDGDVMLSDCEGIELVGRLEDGDLEADDCHGRFDVRSDDGDISLSGRIDAGRLATEDGGVSLTFAPGSHGEFDVETDDGDVSVRVASAVGVEFDLDTGDGSVRFDHPEVTVSQMREGRATGKVGGGELQLRVRTEEGSVRFGER